MAEQAYGPDTNRALRQALVDALNEFVNLLPEPSDEDGDAYLAAMRAGDLPNWGMDDQPLTETTEEWAARVRATRPPGPDASSTRAFAGLPESVSAARSWVAGFFPSPAAAADAALMTSELFTNVILYSASRLPGGQVTVSLMPARQAREVVAGYADLVGPGSYAVISSGRCDDEGLWEQLREAYTAADIWNHPPGEVEGLLAGLEAVPRGSPGRRTGGEDGTTSPPRRPARSTCWPGSRASRNKDRGTRRHRKRGQRVVKHRAHRR